MIIPVKKQQITEWYGYLLLLFYYIIQDYLHRFGCFDLEHFQHIADDVAHADA